VKKLLAAGLIAMASGSFIGIGAASASASTAPITVMMYSQITGPTFGSPETVDAAQATANQINKAGGIHGAKIKIVTCDDKSDPNVAAACARTAVEDKVAAVVVGITINATSALPILAAAKIPWITLSPVSPIENTSTDSYPLAGGDGGNFPAQGAYLVAQGCKKVGIIGDSSAQAQQAASQLKAGVVQAGGKVTTNSVISAQTADVSPNIESILQSGATCLGEAITPSESASVLAAVHGSSDPDMLQVSNSGELPAALLPVVGAAANGVVAISGAYLPTDSHVSSFQSLMKPYGTKTLTTFAEGAWASLEYFADVAKGVSGTVTSSSLTAQLKKTGPVKLAALPVSVSFQKPGPVKAYPRLVNLENLAYKADSGAFTLAQSKSVNGAPGLKLYASTAAPSS
jgi:ABC-type branched-subunit amino acid transport system substrate-binding protein